MCSILEVAIDRLRSLFNSCRNVRMSSSYEKNGVSASKVTKVSRSNDRSDIPLHRNSIIPGQMALTYGQERMIKY